MPRDRAPLHPAQAELRHAVRGHLTAVADAGGTLVLVALSGGPDSLALAAAAAFEGPGAGVAVGAVVVDHGLQESSAETARAAAEAAKTLGLHPVHVERVSVGTSGGPEGAARVARYAALSAAASREGASAVLLGHTLDDQAETVLLGLARGAGANSLNGMAPVAGLYRRPFLGVRRDGTRALCAAEGLTPWNDPQNDDPAFARVRVRHTVLPVLEDQLGPGVAAALARTAEQLREDGDALDAMVEEMIEELCEPAEAGIAVAAAALAANPAALRNRIIRLVANAEFGRSLSRTHTLAIARLATEWRGQGPVDVPGITVTRVDGMLHFRANGAAEARDERETGSEEGFPAT